MRNSIIDPVAEPGEIRNRRHWVIGAVACAAALGGFSLAWHALESPGEPVVMEPGFWQLQFETPDGQVFRIDSLRHKTLLLNFWASWCAPCVEELPLLSGFHSSNVANGWQVLGLAIDERDPVRHFLAQTPISFPVVLAGGPGIELSKSLGNRMGGLPFTAVINSREQIVHRKMGRVSVDDLRAWRAAR